MHCDAMSAHMNIVREGYVYAMKSWPFIADTTRHLQIHGLRAVQEWDTH